MRQVVQAVSGGPVRVVDVPRPTIGPTEVLVRTSASIISPGTERAVTALARASLLDKARARPDLVRQVIGKARTDGLAATTRAVRTRLDDEIALGYSAAGIAVEVGAAVAGITPGQLVATAGGGKANHAEYQAVPGLLCVPVPAGVDAEAAAFATIGAIALHGLRLGSISPGAKVVVLGLGLVGQLALRLARATGADVFGIDLADEVLPTARRAGAVAERDDGAATTDRVMAWSRGRGADVVIVAAATSSSALMDRVPELCRDRAEVVVVGDVALELDRRPFYERELTVRFARSYGPGRYEQSYEDWGVDYPPGHVRWTEGRNLEAVLDLLASGALRVEDLVTHRFALVDAADAYELLDTSDQAVLAIALDYDDHLGDRPEAPIVLSGAGRSSNRDALGLGLLGAGSFARAVLLPSLRSAGFTNLVSVASASGLSARHLGERTGFARAVSGADTLIDDPEVDVVVVATTHDAHAELASRALRAGKHVFCEKPLALDEVELAQVRDALAGSTGVLMVGFNRRWSSPVRRVRDLMGSTGGPLTITYRVNAGPIPEGHWYRDRRQGGRLLGEVCHFVDTCIALVGAEPIRVEAVGGGEGQELATVDDVAVLLGFPDGSVAAITYAAGGHAATEKERIDVLGRGHTATIVDFREIVLDGRRETVRPQDKGHRAQAEAFMAAVRTGDRSYGNAAVQTTLATLAAARALGGTPDASHTGEIGDTEA